MFRCAPLSVVTLSLFGCASQFTGAPQAAPMPLAPPDPAEYAILASSTGQHEISGQAFLTTRGGDVRVAAGRDVSLDPATDYVMRWFRRFGTDANHFAATPDDTLFAKARRYTVADAEGRFRFRGLPEGKYLIRTTVTWETGYSEQGGVVAEVVTVGPEQTEPIILNRVYRTTLAGRIGVEAISTDSVNSRPHRILQRAMGVSCQSGSTDTPPTEEYARYDLLENATRLGAQAVGGVVCREAGRSLIPDCSRRFICEGDVVIWL